MKNENEISMNENEMSNGAILTPGQILKVTTEKMDHGLTGVEHVGATEVRFIEVSERSKWGVTLKVHVPEGGGRRGLWKFSERFFEISPITVPASHSEEMVDHHLTNILQNAQASAMMKVENK